MLRLASLLLISILTSTTALAAGHFDFLPGGSAPEQEFEKHMSAGNYAEALETWTPAHAGTTFGVSASGVATYAYLLYQNGMPFTGLELLIKNTRPGSLNTPLLKLWTIELKNSAYIQRGWIPIRGAWASVVNNEPAAFPVRNKKDIANAFRRADRLPKDQVNAKARILWRLATLAPLAGDLDSSLKALKLLKESGQGVIGQDLVSSTYARVLYQKGDTDAALLHFRQIPKGSSLWVESVEERAWSYLRKDDFDKALGEVTTLISPALSALTGPEPYFLSNLMSLKTCDYPRLFKTSELFKKRHRERLVEMQALSSQGTNKHVASLFERFELNGVSIDAAGPQVWALPRAAYRDARFVRFMETRRALLNESRKAAELREKTAASGGGGELDRFILAASTQSERMKQQALQRLRTLATSEVKEYRVILNKMHVIEAQVIERLHLDENLKGQRGKLSKNDDQGDVLIFPYRSDEVWLDELDNYKARVKDCPTLKGASL